jgi:MYXO-CTERM domain-containing protein
LKNAVACTKNAQCCSGNCQGYVCAPKSAYQAGNDNAQTSSGNGTVAVGVGVGGAVGAAAVIGFVMRRRRRNKQSREDGSASEPLTPHTKATTTPRRVDIVA